MGASSPSSRRVEAAELVSFAFDILESEIDDLDGRSLGHIRVVTDAGTATSEGKTPGQAMMLFLSLPLLMDGLRTFLAAKGQRSFRFNGVGSSFWIVFTRDGAERLRIASGDGDLGSWPLREVVEAIGRGARAFVETYLDTLDLNDMAYDDLDTAVEQFEEAFEL